MPTCRKCDARFPYKLMLDGRMRNLQRRKYCLDCSPFGGHNTRDLHGLPLFASIGSDIECECTRCGREYVYDPRKGHQQTICNSCSANAQRRNRKARAVAYKGGKCECGYDKCLRALEFHHREPGGKEFCVSEMMSMNWARVKKELDKCDLICSNCHREKEEKLIEDKYAPVVQR